MIKKKKNSNKTRRRAIVEVKQKKHLNKLKDKVILKKATDILKPDDIDR